MYRAQRILRNVPHSYHVDSEMSSGGMLRKGREIDAEENFIYRLQRSAEANGRTRCLAGELEGRMSGQVTQKAQ